MIPEGTTHVWTPAVDTPYVGLCFRRAYYKINGDNTWSWTFYGAWAATNNDMAWFKEETDNGYFVTIEKYNEPGFKPKKEIV